MAEHVGGIMQLCSERRGTLLEHKTLEDDDRAVLLYSLPLSETVVDFYGTLKSLTSGYATFDYESAGYEASDLIRLNLLLNGDPVDALASTSLWFTSSCLGTFG
jgi:translation elongation factor EF-4